MDQIIPSNMIAQLSRLTATTPTVPGHVDPAVAAEFASLLQTSTVKATGSTVTHTAIQTNVTSTDNPSMVSILPPLPSQQNSPALASPLLGTLNNFSSEYYKNIATVRKGLASAWDPTAEMSGAQTLEIQRALAESSTSLAIASKVAGSLTAGINQLVKTQ